MPDVVQRPPDLDANGQPAAASDVYLTVKSSRPPDLDASGQPFWAQTKVTNGQIQVTTPDRMTHFFGTQSAADRFKTAGNAAIQQDPFADLSALAKSSGAFRSVPADIDATTPAPNFTTTNAKTPTGEAQVDPNTIGTLVRSFWKEANPTQLGQLLPFPKALGGSGMDHPFNPQNIVDNMKNVRLQADALWDKGDKVGASAKYVESIIPVLGAWMSQRGDEAQRGQWAALFGHTLGLAANVATGKAATGAIDAALPLAGTADEGAKMGAVLQPPTAAESAVSFAQQHDIPLDAATASDNLAVKGAQALADRSLGGSLVATPARANQAAAMGRVGDELAGAVHPEPTTMEQAGLGLRQALTDKVAAHNQDATTAYDTLRDLETRNVAAQTTSTSREVNTGILDASGQPVTRTATTTNSVPLAVDISRQKVALKPLYDNLKRQAELVPLQGDKGRALVALDRLMNGPDVAPLSVVDPALGDLKSMARADIPELRTQGQGAAAVAVKQLEGAVRATAKRAGPEAESALDAGRAATVAKYQTGDVLDGLRDEPVRTVNALTAPKDAAISQLRGILDHVPEQAPVIARAKLEDVLGSTQPVATWNKLGAQTKALLYPRTAAALDQFFALTDRMSKTNVNPSGSGYVAALGAQGAMLWYDPLHAVPLQLSSMALAQAMRSPAVVNALTRGMRLPNVAPVAARVAATANLMNAAKQAGVVLDFPKAAGQEPTSR